MTGNLWAELRTVLNRAQSTRSYPCVVVRLMDGSKITGAVIEAVEGWVKLIEEEPGAVPFWLNMDAIATWQLHEVSETSNKFVVMCNARGA
jgi:hypothetical protein